jgi:hypothetical protein
MAAARTPEGAPAPAPVTAERIEPTFEERAAAPVAAPVPGERIEPTFEAPAAPAPAPAPSATEPEIVGTEAYQTLFNEYRSQGLTRQDADELAKRTLLEREQAEEAATRAATEGGTKGLTPATGLPPVNTWPDAGVLATLELQLAKPEETRNDALVAALEQEVTARGLRAPVGEEGVAETVTTPSGEGVSVAGEPPAGTPTGGLAGAERAGVVPAEADVGQPPAREGEQPSAVTETPEEADARFAAEDAAYQKQVDEDKSTGQFHAQTAFDQRGTYENLDDAIDSYRENLADTLADQGITDPSRINVTLDAFNAEVAKLKAAEAPTAPPKIELAPIEPPKSAAKRGRPKAELTPEQKADKEAQRKANQGALIKADREVKKAVSTLDSFAQPIDESAYADEESLKEAQANRTANRRTAIRRLLELDLDPRFRGTALGKRIKAALARPDIKPQELADIKRGIEATRAPSQSTDPLLRKVNPLLSNVTTGDQAITAIMRTGNAFQKLIAGRLRRFVRGVRVVVVEDGDPTPELLSSGKNAEAWEGARGLFIEDVNGTRTIFLRGASFGADQGVNNVTALHELLHAATNQKLYLGLRALQNNIDVNSSVAKFTREVSTIMTRANLLYDMLDGRRAIPDRVRAIVDSTLRFDAEGKPYYSIFADPHEFLAYGMSDPDFQAFLNALPDEQRQPANLFSRFVVAVREALGIPADKTTALTNLIDATDQLLSARKTPFMRKLEAGERRNAVSAQAKNNAKKVNKTEEKIKRSREAQEITDGLGTLTTLRDPKLFLDVVSAAWSGFNVAKLKAFLPALQTDTIVQWADRLGIKGLDRALRGLQDMGAMRANMLNSAADVTREWLKLQPGIARRLVKGAKSEIQALADVMHYSTDKGIDPTKNNTDSTLNAMWAKLSPQAKKVYARVRDSYKTYFDLYRLLLDKRIDALDIPGDAKDPDTPKGRVMAEIKKMYEASKAISPYFPLMRYGDYWLRIGKGKNVEFYMFESVMERELFLARREREAKAAGTTLDTDKGNSLRELRKRSVSAESSELLKDIFEAVDEAGALDDKEALKDQIYQMYLATMPEQSFRRQFIHRTGRTGFSGDALRNYITSTLNMANQLSRLRYGPQVLNDVEAARKSLEGNPDKAKLEMLVDEMGMRAELDIFPPASDAMAEAAANIANRTAFLYYMTSIKTALSQFASLPIFGAPVLMSRHNPAKVVKEMGRFINVFNQLGVLKEVDGKTQFVMPTIEQSSAVKLNPDEMRAVEAMRDRGLADVTLAYDLMDRRSVPTTKYVGAAKTATNMMGALFHNVERLNREVMYLTSFRLTLDELIAKGVPRDQAVDQAIEQAVDDTQTALGNFTEGNRPRIARGPTGKVLFQFKTFPLFLTTYMVRNFYRMTAGMNAAEKKEAAVQFFGTLGMSYLLAGYVGIPGISFAFGAVQALINAFKDDEEEDPLEEKDLETYTRTVVIPEVFGEVKIGNVPMSDILDAGVLNSISGYDMNSSLSMNNMWFPDLKESATYADTATDYALALAGPFAGLVFKQIPAAMDDFRAGKFDRGVEKLMPNLIRQPLIAARYAKEGATTAAGDVLREKEEFTQGQLVMQALGYRTEGLADAQAANFKANAIRQKVMQEKTRLISRVDLEAVRGSDDEFDNALENLLKFNARYPMVAVRPNELSGMLQRRMETREKADRGFRVDKKFYPYLEVLLEPSRAKLEREAAKPEK